VRLWANTCGGEGGRFDYSSVASSPKVALSLPDVEMNLSSGPTALGCERSFEIECESLGRVAFRARR
jgi:hypothetical protein